MESSLACVHCGHFISSLYKKYDSNILKLTQCSACSKIADKYIEYDNVIVFIDLILFNKEPYRHILFNSDFKNHWKLSIIILLLKTYSHWINSSRTLTDSNNVKGILVTEQTFYSTALIIIAGSTAYFFLLFVLISVNDLLTRQSCLNAKSLVLFIKATTLSNFGQFLLLPSLIWTDLNREINVIFVHLYCAISQMQALSVVCSAPRPLLLIFLLFCLFLDLTVVEVFNNYFMYR